MPRLIWFWAALIVAPPSWGAWIEMPTTGAPSPKYSTVAPPRGERGLKCQGQNGTRGSICVAPPRGERGLKFSLQILLYRPYRVAPPRGERGLK